MWIPDHFFIFLTFIVFLDHCGIIDFRRFVSISHTVTDRTLLGEIRQADKSMNPQHSRSDPADVWSDPADRDILIPEIQIGIPDHILALAGMGHIFMGNHIVWSYLFEDIRCIFCCYLLSIDY